MSAKATKTKRDKATPRKKAKKKTTRSRLRDPLPITTPTPTPTPTPAPTAGCTPPQGKSLVPVTGPPGVYYFDGFNPAIFPFPDPPQGQRLIVTPNGSLAWENV